jgi:NAD(P)-dependent dehydrogenase (short-subunit alcohol dehydrogenase family)
MDLGIRNRVALVTGGGSGIGAEVAQSFAAEGARVVVGDLGVEAAERTAAAIRAAGGLARGARVDVTSADSTEAWVADAQKNEGAVDILVNSAGVWLPAPFAEQTPERAAKELAVCLHGVMNCARAAMKPMVAAKWGRIVSVASDAGRVGERNMATYSAAKGGVIAFSKSLAKEIGSAWVTVNVVCPGTTRTPMTQNFVGDPEQDKKMLRAYALRRFGEPSDIANAIVFLASERASWVTGQTLSVNGGYSMV